MRFTVLRQMGQMKVGKPWKANWGYPKVGLISWKIPSFDSWMIGYDWMIWGYPYDSGNHQWNLYLLQKVNDWEFTRLINRYGIELFEHGISYQISIIYFMYSSYESFSSCRHSISAIALCRDRPANGLDPGFHSIKGLDMARIFASTLQSISALYLYLYIYIIYI